MPSLTALFTMHIASIFLVRACAKSANQPARPTNVAHNVPSNANYRHCYRPGVVNQMAPSPTDGQVCRSGGTSVQARLQQDPPAAKRRRAPPASAPRRRGKGLDAHRRRGKKGCHRGCRTQPNNGRCLLVDEASAIHCPAPDLRQLQSPRRAGVAQTNVPRLTRPCT